GSITKEMLEAVLPGSISEVHALDTNKPIAPGMKYKHYAPDTPLQIVEDFNEKPIKKKDWSKTAFILPNDKRALVPEQSIFIKLCESDNDIKGDNHNLYQILHKINQEKDIKKAYIFVYNITDHLLYIMYRF